MCRHARTFVQPGCTKLPSCDWGRSAAWSILPTDSTHPVLLYPWKHGLCIAVISLQLTGFLTLTWWLHFLEPYFSFPLNGHNSTFSLRFWKAPHEICTLDICTASNTYGVLERCSFFFPCWKKTFKKLQWIIFHFHDIREEKILIRFYQYYNREGNCFILIWSFYSFVLKTWHDLFQQEFFFLALLVMI